MFISVWYRPGAREKFAICLYSSSGQAMSTTQPYMTIGNALRGAKELARIRPGQIEIRIQPSATEQLQ